MKKYILFKLIFCFSIFGLFFAGKFISNTTNTTAQKISDSPITISNFNIINTNSISITSFFYDKIVQTGTLVTVPTFTDTPVLTLIVPPESSYPVQYWNSVNQNPFSQDFLTSFHNSCYVRTVFTGLGTYTTSIDPQGFNSYTVSPTVSPKIEIAY